MKLTRLTSLIVLSLIIAVACNTKSVNKSGESDKSAEQQGEVVMLESGQSYEECIELYPSQVMHYSFKASENVDFNIHYHGMEGRKYAIKKNRITSYKGELVCDEMDFYSKDQEHFCMIWSNMNETQARLSFKYSIGKRQPPG